MKQYTEQELKILSIAINMEFEVCFSDVEEFKVNNPKLEPKESFLNVVKNLLNTPIEEIMNEYHIE